MGLERRGCVVQPRPQVNWQREEPVDKVKPFDIPKREVWEAFKRVKANQGAAGVDGQSIAEFEADLSNNLYILWNRLSSGSYFPPPVRRVEIPKAKGGTRPLGIPTVSDRIAQEVVRRYLEPIVEPAFHVDSYGYRPGKSAIDAVRQARQRCWRHDWVLDLDVKSYFESIDWGLMLTALRRHRIGFVFQSFGLLPLLSALENVDLALRIAGAPRAVRLSRAREVLDLVGLSRRLHHRPYELSGGEQQRVAIARALANRPTLILADEPTGELDSRTGMAIFALLAEVVRGEGVTLITSTHDPKVIEQAARLEELADGAIVPPGHRTLLDYVAHREAAATAAADRSAMPAVVLEEMRQSLEPGRAPPSSPPTSLPDARPAVAPASPEESASDLSQWAPPERRSL